LQNKVGSFPVSPDKELIFDARESF
jgi:hypothetical protein